ncbi:MAG: tryptophan 7-halogenase, partial [Opitutales bacterium]|nr:tryptophan 7-halogenase [Opitutales bacterium]
MQKECHKEQHNEGINSIVIVGGGTAGWLTACTLARNLGSNNPLAIQVSVIESPDIPTIGVGEGTWPTMRRTLQNIGIDEGEFIKRCSATFKQGTKFTHWKAACNGSINNNVTNNSDSNNDYYNLFSSIYDPAEFNLAPYWALGYAGDTISYAEAVSAQALACDRGLAPKKITSAAYEAIQSYAYHLDAGAFARLLRDHAVDNLGVKLITANVQQV